MEVTYFKSFDLGTLEADIVGATQRGWRPRGSLVVYVSHGGYAVYIQPMARETPPTPAQGQAKREAQNREWGPLPQWPALLQRCATAMRAFDVILEGYKGQKRHTDYFSALEDAEKTLHPEAK